jgi:hypothetical protein
LSAGEVGFDVRETQFWWNVLEQGEFLVNDHPGVCESNQDQSGVFDATLRLKYLLLLSFSFHAFQAVWTSRRPLTSSRSSSW